MKKVKMTKGRKLKYKDRPTRVRDVHRLRSKMTMKLMCYLTFRWKMTIWNLARLKMGGKTLKLMTNSHKRNEVRVSKKCVTW